MTTSALALAEELREHLDYAEAGIQNPHQDAILRPRICYGVAIPVEQVEVFLGLVQGSLRHLIAQIEREEK